MAPIGAIDPSVGSNQIRPRWWMRSSTVALGLILITSTARDANAQRRMKTPTSTQFASTWDKRRFSHRLLNVVLGRHVRKGRVDYVGMRGTSRTLLNEYLHRVARTPPGKLAGGASAKLAYWINAHNAVTLRATLDRAPRSRQSARRFEVKSVAWFWSGYSYEVGGRWYTLKQLRRTILVRFKDPRVHFVLFYPARGSPPWSARAFTRGRLKRKLIVAARRFLASKKHGFRYARKSRTVLLSRIFKWHRSDFRRPPYKDVLTFVSKHHSSLRPAALVNGNRDLSISYLSFDWMLNQL